MNKIKSIVWAALTAFLLTLFWGSAVYASAGTVSFDTDTVRGIKIYQADKEKEIDGIIMKCRGEFEEDDSITLTLSDGVYWYMDEDDIEDLDLEALEIEDISDDHKTLYFEVSEDDYDDLEFEELLVATSADAPLGDIEVSIGGDYTGLVIVGQIIPCADIEAETLSVTLGGTEEAAGDITILETYKNSLEPMENPGYAKDGTKYLALSLPDGVTFAASPVVYLNDSQLSAQFYGECFRSNPKNIFSGAQTLSAGDSVCYIKLPDNNSIRDEYIDSIRITDLKYQVAVDCDSIDIPVSISGDMVNKILGAGDELVPNLESDNFEKAIFSVVNATVDKSANSVHAELTMGSKRMFINDKEVLMDTIPYIKEGRFFVPLRYAAYALGMNDDDIFWDGNNQTVTLTRDLVKVVVQVDSNTLLVNGEAVQMYAAPELKEGRVSLPIRYVAEAFGGTVGWDGNTNVVTIDVE